MKAKTELERFQEAMRQILKVPKEEIDRRAAKAKKDPKTGRYVDPKKA